MWPGAARTIGESKCTRHLLDDADDVTPKRPSGRHSGSATNDPSTHRTDSDMFNQLRRDDLLSTGKSP
jgi:hypothetical protein